MIATPKKRNCAFLKGGLKGVPKADLHVGPGKLHGQLFDARQTEVHGHQTHGRRNERHLEGPQVLKEAGRNNCHQQETDDGINQLPGSQLDAIFRGKGVSRPAPRHTGCRRSYRTGSKRERSPCRYTTFTMEMPDTGGSQRSRKNKIMKGVPKIMNGFRRPQRLFRIVGEMTDQRIGDRVKDPPDRQDHSRRNDRNKCGSSRIGGRGIKIHDPGKQDSLDKVQRDRPPVVLRRTLLVRHHIDRHSLHLSVSPPRDYLITGNYSSQKIVTYFTTAYAQRSHQELHD